MKRVLRFKKRTYVLAGVVAVIAAMASVGAYAYWTATGTGDGTATVGTSANKLYVLGTTTGPSLTPNGPSEVVHFSAYNFASNDESISKIHLTGVKACDVPWTLGSTASYPVPAATCGGTVLAPGDCGTISDGASPNPVTPVADFYMGDVTVNPSTDGNILASASGQAMTTTGTLVMNNVTTHNQNACKSQNLLLTFTTS